MKKNIFACFTGLLLAWTVAGYSQASTATAKLKSKSSLETFISSPEELEKNVPGNSIPVSINEVNPKVAKHFTRDYKNVTDVKWFNTSKGLFVAYFLSNDIKTLVCYNKKGIYECMMRYYNE